MYLCYVTFDELCDVLRKSYYIYFNISSIIIVIDYIIRYFIYMIIVLLEQ